LKGEVHGEVQGEEKLGFHEGAFQKNGVNEFDLRTVNSLYEARQAAATMPLKFVVRLTHPAVANITLTRRQNTLILFQDYAKQALAAGAPTKGLEQAFATLLQISPSMWSQIKSSRPIGDKLARQIEQHQGKTQGWLDEARDAVIFTPSERAFLDLALAAWRATNVAGRKAIREQLKSIAEGRH
jgi:hypothetical protein